MSDFHQRSFAQRFDALGDMAEGAFTIVNPKAARLGLNRPSFSMARMAANLRYTPDYLLADGFYEVQGFSSRSKSGSLKTKVEKLDALTAWATIGPCNLWVYDSHKPRYWCADIQTWAEAFHTHGVYAEFPDNNRGYYDLKPEAFPCDPTPMPELLGVVIELAA